MTEKKESRDSSRDYQHRPPECIEKELKTYGLYTADGMNRAHRLTRWFFWLTMVSLLFVCLFALSSVATSNQFAIETPLSVDSSLLGVFLSLMGFLCCFFSFLDRRETINPAPTDCYRVLCDMDLEPEVRGYISSVRTSGRDWLSDYEATRLARWSRSLKAYNNKDQVRHMVMTGESDPA